MALLERIMQMKQTGMSENAIAKSLMAEGISPREVAEGLSQSSIKSAVSQPFQDANPSTQEMQDQPNNLQPSIMQDPSQMQNAQYAQQYPPQMQEQEQVQQEGVYSPYSQEYQQQYPQDQTQAQQGAYYQQTPDLETIRDISKQVLEEEMSKLKQQIDDIMRMKSEMKFQLQNLENRLGKIEETIQSIQLAILKKISSYGESIENISKEMSATQESFSKMINPIMNQKRNINQQSSFQQQNQPQSQNPNKNSNQNQQQRKNSNNQSNQKPGFENYLR